MISQNYSEIAKPRWDSPGGSFSLTDSGPWFVLQVAPNRERQVVQMLSRKGISNFLPFYVVRRRWSDRVRQLHLPLFPGYVFCRIPPGSPKIVSTPGVIRFVSFGGAPEPMPEAEIQVIRKMLESGRAITPWPYLAAGQCVRIENGPLHGLEGVVLKIGKGSQLLVSLHFLQRSVAVAIEREDIAPLGTIRTVTATH